MSIRQHDFTIERRFRQTPAQAFRAFADPELKQRWFGVPEGWTDANWELDFRLGGSEGGVGGEVEGGGGAEGWGVIGHSKRSARRGGRRALLARCSHTRIGARLLDGDGHGRRIPSRRRRLPGRWGVEGRVSGPGFERAATDALATVRDPPPRPAALFCPEWVAVHGRGGRLARFACLRRGAGTTGVAPLWAVMLLSLRSVLLSCSGWCSQRSPGR